MIVLGLDPSLTAYGWAALLVEGGSARVIAAGCIRAKLPARAKHGPRTAGSAARLAALARELLEVMGRHPGARIVAELPMGGRNAATAKALGQSFALTVTCAEVSGSPAAFVTPLAAKRAATGRTDADKHEVAEGVATITGWRSTATAQPAREAEADAVAVALTATASA